MKKFPIGEVEEKKWCRVAVKDGLVELPEGVTSGQFGNVFYKSIRTRMNGLRANFQTSARTKFESKCAQIGLIGLHTFGNTLL